MLIIGERINGLYKDVARALQAGDKEIIQNLARAQDEGGAGALDINTGPAAVDAEKAIRWLVESVQEVCKLPLVIDSPRLNVLKAGIETCRNRVIINSTTAQQEKLETLLPLAVEHNCALIGLTMDENGIPAESMAKAELGLRIIAACSEAGLNPENLFLDPLILPVKVTQNQVKETLEAIRLFKTLSSPAPQVLIGLSNVSQGTQNRSLINRTYLVMAMSSGLDAAILDPLDKELMDAVYTAEILLDQKIYCDSYLPEK